MKSADVVMKELRKYIEPDRAHVLSSFFKTGKGQYGEGDVFIGVTVPNSRIVAKQAIDLEDDEILKLLMHHIHEYRLVALHSLTYKIARIYSPGYLKNPGQTAQAKKAHKKIVDLYMSHKEYVNNWDLVDASAHYILGSYLFKYCENPAKILLPYAKSGHLWTRRIAMIATFYGIQAYGKTDGKNILINDTLKPTYDIALVLLQHKEDLIQKAVGWMLREAGKRDENRLRKFLDVHAATMPRTALRYAIEKFDEKDRGMYLAKRVLVKK